MVVCFRGGVVRFVILLAVIVGVLLVMFGLVSVRFGWWVWVLVGDLLCFGFGLRLLMFGVGVCCLVLWWFGLLFACTVVMCTLVGGWVDLVVDCSLWLCWFIVVRLSLWLV